MCDNDADGPFCSPQDGAQLQTGETVTITWNPLFFTTASFPNPPFDIFIQADFPITANGPPETAGFTSTPLDPNTGAFPWPILASYLPPTSNASIALLSIAAPLPQTSTNGSFIRTGAGTTRFPGPQVHILRASQPTPSSSPPTDQQQQQQQQQQPQNDQQQNPTSPNPLAIALPIAFGLLTALAMVGYALLKRHRPETLARLAFWKKRTKGNSSSGSSSRSGGGGGRGRVRGREVEIRVVRTDLEGLRANAAKMAVGGGGGGGGLREGV
ncbi:hypothetical protein C8A00DRAFT_18264 [Chaetomidium leptoderma]|uniref:Uncharacterized protein n=1 Tax=Chaetomidium leptoderma TaxID=669021 RepID=A0AAN6VEU5_9PEZI|nr:hypothetical protein C8A00DRAFT_18264 [Chaetomidium leptoderma]